MGDVVTPLYNILNAQAGLDQTRAVTQDTQALAQMRIQNLILSQQATQREQAMRERLQSSAFANPTGGAAPPVNGNPPPLTTSIYGIDFDANDPLVLSAKSAQEGVNLSRQRLALTQEAGDVQGYFKAQQDHDNQQNENRLAMKDLAVDALRRTKEAAQAFGSVETADDLKSALLYVNDNVSKKQAQAIATQLQKSLPDPNNATPEQIAAAVAPITNRYASMGDQLRFRGSQQAAQDRAAALDERTRHNKEIEATAAQRQAGVNATDLSEGAITDAADVYNSTGKIPALYRDSDSKKLIMNRANERKAEGVSLPAAQADFKSNSLALNSLTKDIATIRPYKDMLDTNAEILKTLAKDAIKTDAALVNKPINWIEQNMAGDPKTAEFLAQMHFVQSEAARVIQNPRLVGPMTDTAKQELNAVINGNMSLGQVESVINRIQSDGQNRVAAMEKERQSLVDSMKGGKSAVLARSPAAPPPAPTQGVAPPAAVEFLKSNPALKEQFRAKYGYLPAGM